VFTLWVPSTADSGTTANSPPGRLTIPIRPLLSAAAATGPVSARVFGEPVALMVICPFADDACASSVPAAGETSVATFPLRSRTSGAVPIEIPSRAIAVENRPVGTGAVRTSIMSNDWRPDTFFTAGLGGVTFPLTDAGGPFDKASTTGAFAV
jgi:hypothetical protein